MPRAHPSCFPEISKDDGWPHASPVPLSPLRCLHIRGYFLKVLNAVLAPLSERGLRVFHYLDDIMLLAPNPEQLLKHRSTLLSTLTDFGWLVDWEKSLLTPTQSKIYLGALFNTSAGTVCLPPPEGSNYCPEDVSRQVTLTPQFA